MTMPGALARCEMTTEERCEYLLGIIACAVTRRPPSELFPWVRQGLSQFLAEVTNG